jgi:uncharacterized protein (DUF433 family)
MMVELAPGIVADPKVRFGKAIIRGTRVPVSLVLGKLAGGMSAEAVAAEYELTVDDVQAALRYAASVIAGEEIVATALRA